MYHDKLYQFVNYTFMRFLSELNISRIVLYWFLFVLVPYTEATVGNLAAIVSVLLN